MKSQALPIPSRESTSHGQLQALLMITQALQPYLILPPQENIPRDPQIDGGTVAAAATTFIKTCGKIDDLLADLSRWSLESQDALYNALVQTQEQQQKFLQAQIVAAASIARPSFQFKPVLVAVEGGYAAIHDAVVGYGVTPEAAMADFDLAFQRIPQHQHKIEATQEMPNSEKKTNRKKK